MGPTLGFDTEQRNSFLINSVNLLVQALEETFLYYQTYLALYK